MALSPGSGSALAGVVNAKSIAGAIISHRRLLFGRILGGGCYEDVVHSIIGVADACVCATKVVVVRSLLPYACQTQACDERLTCRFALRVVAITDNTVIYHDDIRDDAVLNLCEVCHYATTNVPDALKVQTVYEPLVDEVPTADVILRLDACDVR